MDLEMENTASSHLHSQELNCSGNLAASTTSVRALVRELEDRVHELDAEGLNDRQILGSELLIFLASPQGREFGDNLRHETFSRLDEAQEKSRVLREEIDAAEQDLRVASRVFAFVEFVIYHSQRHRVTTAEL
jgi:hypothetical protein